MKSSREQRSYTGLATARGFAAGPAFVFRGGDEIPIPGYLVEPGHEGDEILRLHRSLVEVKRDLSGLISVLRERTGRSDVRVFECHLMLLEDSMLLGEIEGFIRNERLNAESAVSRTMGNARAKFERMNDAYFRERVRDIDDIERRLLKSLTGFGEDSMVGLTVPSIVIADDLAPSEIVQLPRELVLGFATNGGSTTSHVALLARAMGIPAVTGLGNITQLVQAGEMVLLDGSSGSVILEPNAATVREFIDLVERQRELSEDAIMGAPAGTLKGGGEIKLYANIHPGVPFDGIREQGARGVGLYRSEYLWLNREQEPTEDEQFAAYREAVEFCKTLGTDSTLTIRVLDIGGDKTVRGITQKESNPFLGNRSIRYLLSNPGVFRTQLRAIYRASKFGRICLLIPMISCLEEIRSAKQIIAEVQTQLDAEGVGFDRELPIGAMIEVPSAALIADALAQEVQFFSIGTNDLVQYTMAADRGNESVANLYQPTNPAVLKLMRMTIEAAHRHHIHVGVCGESASDPVDGILWAAMGVEMLSMSATYIPVISKLLSRLSRADLDEYLQMVDAECAALTGPEIYAKCRQWMATKIFDFDQIDI